MLHAGTVPRWSPLATRAVLYTDHWFWQAEHAVLQLELTRKVLRAREVLNQGGTAALAAPELAASECAATTWRITSVEDGGFVIELASSPPPPSPSGNGSQVPLRHVEPPAIRPEGTRIPGIRPVALWPMTRGLLCQAPGRYLGKARYPDHRPIPGHSPVSGP